MGAELVETLYPTVRQLPEADRIRAVTMFARDFMDSAIGNYTSSQRPALFQGTLGQGLGLFQTYMLTFAQNLYRNVEEKNLRAIGSMFAAQTVAFGAGSYPGFNAISQVVGTYFSDDNVDLKTGMLRALPEGLEDFIVYGAPSSIGHLFGQPGGGPGLYGRGELSVRAPDPSPMAALNMASSAYQSLQHMVKAMGSPTEDLPRAFGEALSMQTVNRPLARWSEIASGYSVTGTGQTIATPEEVRTTIGIGARLASTRPLQEMKMRDAIHLNSYYGMQDRDKRLKVTQQLRVAIRNNTLNDSLLTELAEEYMRTGTPQGWRAAVQEAIIYTERSGRESLIRKLDHDSPIHHLINGMD